MEPNQGTCTGREELTSISFHPDVYAELSQSYEYYERKSKGLGHKFLLEVESQFEYIKLFPSVGQDFLQSALHKQNTPSLKRFPMKTFPYSIVYQATMQEIIVMAVIHHRRHPKYWISRLETFSTNH